MRFTSYLRVCAVSAQAMESVEHDTASEERIAKSQARLRQEMAAIGAFKLLVSVDTFVLW
jgi:hypothetical protein